MRKPILFVALLLSVSACSSRELIAGIPKQGTGQPGGSGRKPGAAKAIVYTKKQYAFRFSLPKSWKGYSIVVGEWDGSTRVDEQIESPQLETGPIISIRNPLWTKADPHQDIPIMVFTHPQWNSVQSNKLIVSAAPIGPSDIGQNAKYVFALPPRFEDDSATGWEEVLKILKHNPLHAF